MINSESELKWSELQLNLVMPKVRKNISKRCTLRKKYSVDKKVKDHKKKLKKEIRKMKKTGVINQKPMKKIMGLPNLYPLK